MSGTTTLTFSWPANTNNQYASVKLWVSNPNASYTLSFPNVLTLGDTDTIAGFSGNTVTFSSAEISNSTDYFFEVFTVDGGTTLGIRDLGRNRTKALSGLQVNGNLTASANLITNAGTINTNYAYVTLTNDQNFFANTGYNTVYFDTASSATIGNARIALPDTDVDGREITLSFLAPITSVWVNKGNTALVKWFPNTTVSSGNVVAKFTYSVANSNWLRS
jgi:hypothetical protein